MIPVEAVILLELYQEEGAAMDLVIRLYERTDERVSISKPSIHRKLNQLKRDGLIVASPRALVKGSRCYGNKVWKLSPAGRTEAEGWRRALASLLGIQEATPSDVLLPNKWGHSIWRWFVGCSPAGFELISPVPKVWGPCGVPVLLGARLHGLPLVELIEDTPLELVPPGVSLHASRVLKGRLEQGDVFQARDEDLFDPPEEVGEFLEKKGEERTREGFAVVKETLNLPD